MRIKKYRTFVADFETTVFENQDYTEVWASASAEMYTENVEIFHSLEEQFDYLISLNSNVIVYFHNLKFDGGFWLPFLLQKMNYKQAYTKLSNDSYEWKKDKYMDNKTFKYSISQMGQWYSIIIKVNNRFIEIRDSLKLLPFSVERIGQSFGTKHKKLDMVYKGFRYAGCEITDKEKEYIANDVLVVKEALEIMFNDGHNKLTIGACCLEEYKKSIGKDDYNMFFPQLENMSIDKDLYDYSTVDEYIRSSYRGGWCYVVKGKEHKLFKKGVTADVNSLYPSMMSSESGNYFPVGNPCFWSGNTIPTEALKGNRYYFVRVKTRFYIKEDKLPFIQIKNTFKYKGNDVLETSDIYNPKTNKYVTHYRDKEGILHDTRVTLTFTMTDYKLFLEHYNVVDFEIIDGCWFFAEIGLFDNYIEKYKKIKINSEGATRESAKLFLNNLYGKMASNTDSSFKVAYEKANGSIGFITVSEKNKKAGYIPVGSAITSYARNFTIRTAQKNYYGKDKAGFIYADTDSIHCDLPLEKLKGLNIHPVDFCCWSIESVWSEAIFTRQKTYIEYVIQQTKKGEIVDVKPFYDVKCAGMPSKCKELFVKSIVGITEEEEKNYTEEELEFIKKKKTIEDFKVGLKVMGKLSPRRIKGGIVLMDTTYEMR